MGTSGRAAHAIDPQFGDLLMPDRTRARPASRDVEDACFETVDVIRGKSEASTRSRETHTVFKSRLTRSPENGPFPPDFADPGPTLPEFEGRPGRLGIFAGKQATVAPWLTGLSVTILGAIVIVGGLAVAGLWMGSGPASQPLPKSPAPVSTLPAVTESPRSLQAPVAPDPVTTSSIVEDIREPSRSGYSAPKPRPARIEKAGSILMIRPASD